MNTILLLEDDANLNRGISLKLRKEGYDVYSAFTIKEAEDLFSACSPDLIISLIVLVSKVHAFMGMSPMRTCSPAISSS